MGTGIGGLQPKTQAARHAQVDQQQAALQIHQQVLATPAHRPAPVCPTRHRGVTPQRPPQWFAWNDGLRCEPPAIRSAKLRRVTSTSGSSGMGMAWLEDGRQGLDYYGSMHRTPRFAVLILSVALMAASPLQAQSTDPAPEKEPNSALNGELFYQLLLGEVNALGGEPGLGYQLILDAAQKDRRQRGCTGAPRTSPCRAAPVNRPCRPPAPGGRPSLHRAMPTVTCCRS